MRIEPSAGTKVRFDKQEVLATPVIAGETRNYKLSRISYSWHCLINNEQEKFCSLLDASPTAAPTDTNVYDDFVRTFYINDFEALQEFTGQTTYTQSFFGRKPIADGYLVFGVTLIEEAILNTSVKNIKLPKIWVNDIQYELPDYKLETVTEKYMQ